MIEYNHDIQLEELILGTVLKMPKALEQVSSMLKPEYFYKPFHKDIVIAIHKLIKDRQQVDIVTVLNIIENKTTQTAVFLSEINERCDYGSIDAKVHKLAEKYFSRELLDMSIKAASMTQEGKDFFDVKDFITSEIINIQKQVDGIKGDVSFPKSVDKVIAKIKETKDNPTHVSGIPTGNAYLDRMTGGWQKTDLIILAARPGMGKTARALNFLKSASEAGNKCQFFSFEMSTEQLIKRLLAEGASIDLEDINRGRVSEYSFKDISEVAERIKKLPIMVNDNGRLNINDVASKCRLLKAKGELDMVIIDYLQICKAPKGNTMNRDSLLGMFTGEFKDIAKECDIPVMVLCQVGRAAEVGNDKRPELKTLRESGSIEQDADVVGFLFRPAYYTKNDQEKETDDFFREMDNREYLAHSEFIIAKHRNGKLGIIKEYFDGRYQRFSDTLYPEIAPTENLPF